MANKHPEHEKLEAIIKRAIAAHDRTLQREIGASELGTPCDRRLALKLIEAPEININLSNDWRPTVGTAVHDWLHRALLREAKRKGGFVLQPEVAMAVGTLAPGVEVLGHADVYDPEFGIVDWKILGVTHIREIASAIKRGDLDPVGPEYRTQLHAYARGVEHALGVKVDNVAVYILPNNGTLADAIFWTEPYDPDFIRMQFKRARELYAEVQDENDLDAYIRNLPTTFHHCGHCPFFDPTARPNQWKRCSGDPAMAVEDDTTSGLIPT